MKLSQIWEKGLILEELSAWCSGLPFVVPGRPWQGALDDIGDIGSDAAAVKLAGALALYAPSKSKLDPLAYATFLQAVHDKDPAQQALRRVSCAYDLSNYRQMEIGIYVPHGGEKLAVHAHVFSHSGVDPKTHELRRHNTDLVHFGNVVTLMNVLRRSPYDTHQGSILNEVAKTLRTAAYNMAHDGYVGASRQCHAAADVVMAPPAEVEPFTKEMRRNSVAGYAELGW